MTAARSEPRPMPEGPLAGVATRLAGLGGWRRSVVAFLAGALATLALPPLHLIPVFWLSVPVLLWLLRGSAEAVKPGRNAFWTGWWFGFGHFLLGLYWVSVALWVDIARWWWVLPLAVAGLPMLLAAFTGLAALLHAILCRRYRIGGLAEVLVLAGTWTTAELLRAHLFTGFPWNLAGYAWTPVLPVVQFAALAGVYGLSLLTLAVSGLPALLADRRDGWRPLAAGLVVLAVVAAGGAWRLSDTQGLTVPDVRLRLVQAAIPQQSKWKAEVARDNFAAHVALSTAAPVDPAAPPPTHVVWAETAVPWLLGDDPRLLRWMGTAAPPGGLLLTGAARAVRDDQGRRFHNSLLAVTPEGLILDAYDKAHLVPFGEYLPFRGLLPGGLSAVAAVGADATPGPGPRTLPLPGLPPVSPLICYEVIFPGAVTGTADGTGARPAWLLNVTNDAWYGETAGPWQHFAIARMRAVEEGLPLVRVANTGISGVVDAYGRVTGHIPLGRSGFLDTDLPAAAASVTPWGRFGLILSVMSLFCIGLWVGFLIRRV